MASVLKLYANANTFDRSLNHTLDFSIQNRPGVVPPPQSGIKIADLSLRAMGAGFIGIAAVSIRLLITLIHSGAGHSLTPVEFLVAFVGVVTGCLGNILLWHGSHINDLYDVSQRWRRY